MAESGVSIVRANVIAPENVMLDTDVKDPRVQYFNLQFSQYMFLLCFLIFAWFLGYWGFSSIWIIFLLVLFFTGDIYTRKLALRRKLDSLLLNDELKAVEEIVETLPSWACLKFIIYYEYA